MEEVASKWISFWLDIICISTGFYSVFDICKFMQSSERLLGFSSCDLFLRAKMLYSDVSHLSDTQGKVGPMRKGQTQEASFL